MIATPRSTPVQASSKGRRLVRRLVVVLVALAILWLAVAVLAQFAADVPDATESFFNVAVTLATCVGLLRGSRVARWFACVTWIFALFLWRAILPTMLEDPWSFHGVVALSLLTMHGWIIYVLLFSRNVDAFFREMRRKAWLPA